MKAPEIDLNELEQSIKENNEERLKFIDSYSEWLKAKSNGEWSLQQKKIIDK